MRIVSSAAVVAVFGSACNPFAQCEEAVSLIDPVGWSLVDAEDDPFVEGDPSTFFAPEDDLSDPRPQRCSDNETQPTTIGLEPAYDIDTALGCNWATLEQPLTNDLAQGDALKLRIFYFSQFAFEEAEASVVVKIGDATVADERVPIPTSSGLIAVEAEATEPASQGARVLWHVGNHGDNSWNFIELATFRPAVCPETPEEPQ